MLFAVKIIAAIRIIDDAHFRYQTLGCWDLRGVEVFVRFSCSLSSSGYIIFSRHLIAFIDYESEASF